MANLLIVDDDRDVSAILSDLLQGAGHFVRTAATGEEGLCALGAAQLPECILLDVEMPVLTGPEMAHRMLLHDAGEELVPIVLLSGSADLSAIAARVGTPYFITKPADGRALLDLIDRAVREGTAPSFAGMKEEIDVDAGKRALASPERDSTDHSLRDERDKTDAERAKQRSEIERDADDVIKSARSRADDVQLRARDEALRTSGIHPVTEAVRAESRRKGRAADAVTSSKRVKEDEALARERSKKQRILDDFLEAERVLTDDSLEEERLHSDVTVASRDQFLGMVSHDLRSMLHGVNLNVSLIARSAACGEPGASTRKRTANIQRVVSRMNRLIGDLLDIASIEAGSLNIVLEPSDPHQLVTETLEAFAELAKSKGITVDSGKNMDADAPLDARLDHGRVVQVLANLLSNAIKFTQAGGHITVRVVGIDDKVQFSVADDGPGIPTDFLTAIFERYRQIHADRRGLGLGLYISKSIVEAHGGTIWVESQVSNGTTFYFAIPRGASAETRPRVASGPPRAQTMAYRKSGSMR